MYELSEEQQGVGHKLLLLDQDASTLDREGEHQGNYKVCNFGKETLKTIYNSSSNPFKQVLNIHMNCKLLVV